MPDVWQSVRKIFGPNSIKIGVQQATIACNKRTITIELYPSAPTIYLSRQANNSSSDWKIIHYADGKFFFI